MLPRSWPARAALAVSVGLVLLAPVPARAADCGLLNVLVDCSPSESGLEVTPEGLLVLPGSGQSPPPAPPPPAPAAVRVAPSTPTSRPDLARLLLDLANEERAQVGSPMLSSRQDVVDMALAHTREMLGSGGGIFHNLDLLTVPLRNVLGALTVGENVGWSTHPEDLHPRFMASAGHRAALLDPRFTIAGFAVIQDTDGRYYATENFVQPSGAAPASAPDPRPSLPPPGGPAPELPPGAGSTAPEAAPEPSSSGSTAVPTAGDAAPPGPRRADAAASAGGDVVGLVVEPSATTASGHGPAGVALFLVTGALVGHAWRWLRCRPRV